MGLSTEQFVYVFNELLDDPSKIIQNGFLMLKANYRAENREITALQLAKSAGYDSFEVGNKQYGNFAHKVCDFMNFEPEEERDGTPIWTYTICDASKQKDDNGCFQWILKSEVAAALEEMGLVKPISISNIFADIEEKSEKLEKANNKEREAIILARIGQGIFRENLINHWKGCSVTGFRNTEFLVASHIKPWRDCDNDEALDMPNGLLLLPNIDRAFDRGFISFNSNGGILLSPQLHVSDAKALGLHENMKLRWCYPQHEEYLKFHRENFFRVEY